MIWRRWRDMASWLADGLPALSKRLLSLFLRALWGLHPEAGPWWPPKLSSLCLYLSIRAVFSCFLPWESSVFYLIFRLFVQSKDITQMGKRPCLLHGEGCGKYPCELHGFAAGFSCTSVSSLNQKSESATSAIKEPSNIRQMGLKHWQMKARPTEANGNRLRKTNIHT